MPQAKISTSQKLLIGCLMIISFVFIGVVFEKDNSNIAIPDHSPVAKFTAINGQTEITRYQLDTRLALLQAIHPQITESLNSTPGMRINMEQQILSGMIDSLLYKAAVTTLGLELDVLVTESIYQNLRQQVQNQAIFPDEILLEYAIETNYTQTLFAHFQNQITEARLHEFWEANPWIGDIPAMVNLSNIVVATEAEAKDIRAQIIAGADFGELAATLSIEPGADATRGNKIFPVGQIGEQIFADTVNQTVPGDISQPIKTGTGWQIVKLINNLEGKELSFGEARPQLLGQVSHTELLSHLQKLRDTAEIEILLATAQPQTEQQ